MHTGRWAIPGAAPGSSEPLRVPAAQHPAGVLTGSALAVLVQHSSPLKPSQMNQQHSQHEALSPGTPRAHCTVPLEKCGGTATSCSLGTSVFGSCTGCRGYIPGGTGICAWLCVCTASETWLVGHGRCKDFQSFPVLSHILRMGV